MKKILLTLFIAIPFAAFSQKDCNIKQIKNPFDDGTIKGEKINGISFRNHNGQFVLTKVDTSLKIIYKIPVLPFTRVDKIANVKLRSADIIFDKTDKIQVKLEGFGITDNSASVKPIINFTTLTFVVSQALKDAFLKADKTITLTLNGDGNSEGVVDLTKADIRNIKQALSCL